VQRISPRLITFHDIDIISFASLPQVNKLTSYDLILKAVTNGSWKPWKRETHPAQYLKNMGMDVSHILMSAMRGNIHLIIIIGKIGAKEDHRILASDKFAFHLNLSLELKDTKQ
jgi:hypothetical protein